MILKLELKSCADLDSTTYLYTNKTQLRFPFTFNLRDEVFPKPARQRKWIKKLLITWYQEMNERGRYSALMIEITSATLLSCRFTSLGPYSMSPWLQLRTCQLECLAEFSGSCGRLHTQICITHQLHLTSRKPNKNMYKTETFTWSCKEIVFPYGSFAWLKRWSGHAPRLWGDCVTYVH